MRKIVTDLRTYAEKLSDNGGLRHRPITPVDECDHPRSERVYIGSNTLRCNKCGKEFK
jgi:hypothetical protein